MINDKRTDITEELEIKPNIPRTLILDADDSYTRNILDLILKVYPDDPIEASQQIETRVLLIRANKFDWNKLSTEIIPHFALIILGPGSGRPIATNNNQHEIEHPSNIFNKIISPDTLPKFCNGHYITTFGLCLGHQSLGFAYGAKIQPAPRVLHGQTCKLEIELDEFGKKKGILNLLDQDTTEVVRYNSLTLDPNSISKEQLEITAWSKEGEFKSIMGLKHKTLPFHSVQFHPESVCSTHGDEIIKSLFNSVSTSSYVKSDSGLGEIKSYSSLPNHILELNDIKNYSNLKFNNFKQLFKIKSFIIKSDNSNNENIKETEYVFKELIYNFNRLGQIWLDSADTTAPNLNSKLDRSSHMASIDLLISYFSSQRKITITKSDSNVVHNQYLNDQNFWVWLREIQNALQQSTELLPTDNEEEKMNAPVGFMGYLNYELLTESLPNYKFESRSKPHLPDSELGFCNTALTFNHSNSTWIASALISSEMNSNQDFFKHQFGFSIGLSDLEFQIWKQKILNFFQSNLFHQQQENLPTLPRSLRFKLEPKINEIDYLKAISNAKEKIKLGESYELCLTNQFHATLKSNLNHKDYLNDYLNLRKLNPAPYGAFINFKPNDIHILSSSPERFISVDYDSNVEMKPIKGTAKRNVIDSSLDLEISLNLQNNSKERAENLMITDLIKNDLINFCQLDSIKVSKLFHVETVATVHNLVSTLNGKLKSNLNSIDAISYSFPPGSMTGAPKISSIQILDQLEFQNPRGPYSGILGFIAIDGRADMSVVIRTAIIRGEDISIGGGGAITYLSNEIDELNEVKLKVDAVQRNLFLN